LAHRYWTNTHRRHTLDQRTKRLDHCAIRKSNSPESIIYLTSIQGVNGQVYVVLTKGNGTVTDNDIIAGPAIVEVGDVASP
jgi:hypothetical protein